MRRTLLVAVFLVTMPVLFTSLSAAAQETIGIVRSSEGKATVTRGGQILPADEGTKLLVGDALRTGSDGSLGVILRDNSTLSLGPESSFVIQKFLFSPAEGKLGLMDRLTKGTMAYLSGLIGKLAPESVRFETPTASIGVRGTHFAVKTGEPASQ
ncbi:MAG TPA: FecR family protein [Candidatus Deferrimicrobiaceae bacterium]|nr:FecR family protein [Candidatus Deferrimicrobiaceae bacterium]